MSRFPIPVPGQVIRYSYLWQSEYLQGREEGIKGRFAAIILVTQEDSGESRITVLPITHTPPKQNFYCSYMQKRPDWFSARNKIIAS